jgi:hypothetical protein
MMVLEDQVCLIWTKNWRIYLKASIYVVRKKLI